VALELWVKEQEEQDTTGENWKKTLEQLLPGRINPSTTGFIDELISLRILGHVEWEINAENGATPAIAFKNPINIKKPKTFNGQHTRNSPTNITSLATWFNTLDEGEALQLNPTWWNYAHADSVVLVKLQQSELTLIEIQVTYTDPGRSEKKASNTAKFFSTEQWKSFLPDPNIDSTKVKKILLWICPESCTLPTLDSSMKDIFQAHLSFKHIFKLGGLTYSKPKTSI
jgi:hypothetical protein